MLGDNYFGDFIKCNTYLILVLNQFYFILFPVLFFVVINKINMKDVMRFNKLDLIPGILILLISVPAYFGAGALNMLVTYLLQFVGYFPDNSIPAPQNIGELLMEVLVVAVSPSICEEMLHRGILLKAYEKRGSAKAVVISSILFGIFHYDITNLLGPLLLGLLIGYYVIRTNSIFAGMLAHFSNNFIFIILQYIYRNSKDAKDTLITVLQLREVLLFGMVCIAVVFILMLLFNRCTNGRYYFKPSGTSIRNDIISIISHWPIAVCVLIYALMVLLILLQV